MSSCASEPPERLLPPFPWGDGLSYAPWRRSGNELLLIQWVELGKLAILRAELSLVSAETPHPQQ
eukprot:10191412-Lingulodinium_polyedra.AAC.1